MGKPWLATWENDTTLLIPAHGELVASDSHRDGLAQPVILVRCSLAELACERASGRILLSADSELRLREGTD